MESDKFVKHHSDVSKKPQSKLPTPERFIEYNEFPDHKRFMIPDTDYIFYFDEFRGWSNIPKVKLNIQLI